MPTTNVSTVGTGGNYTSWTLWEAATDNDLVALDVIERGDGLTETLAAASFAVAGAVTDATRYRILQSQTSHAGVYGAGHVMTGNTFTLAEANVIMRDITVRLLGGSTTYLVNTTALAYLQRCFIVADAGAFPTYTVSMDAGGHIRACCVIGSNRGIAFFGTVAIECSNCTTIGRSNVISDVIPYIGYANNASGVVTVKNCIADGYGRDFGAGLTQANNASRDGSAAGAGSLIAKIHSNFRFRTSADLDFHPLSSSAMAGAGADLSASFNYDITGAAMPAAWPIGAFRPCAAPTFAGASSAVNNQDGSILVSWSAATANVSAIRGYKVHVHTATMTDADLDADTYLLAEIPAGDTSVDVWTTADGVTALTSGTTYFFAVRAVSLEDDEDQNATNQSVAPSLTAPTFGGLTSATDNVDGSAVLAWSAATFGSTVPTDARRYKIHVHTATMTDADLDADTYLLCSVDSVQTSLDVFTLSNGVTALTSGTTYYFAVRAFQRVAQLTSEDQNTTNQSATVTNGVTAPTAAINGHIGSITNTGFIATLDAFPSTNIDRWRVGYRIKNDTASSAWTYSSANTTVAANQTITVTGLTASNIYEVFFQGGNGTSTWGDPGEIAMIFTSSTSNTWDGTQITNQIMTLIDDNLTSGLSLSRVTQYGSLADYPQDRDVSAQLPLCMVELLNVSYSWARFPKGYDIVYQYRILYAKEYVWTAAVVQDRVDSLGRLVGLFADFRQLGLNGGSTTEGQVASVLVTEASTRPEEDQLKPHDRIFVVGLTLEVTARAQA